MVGDSKTWRVGIVGLNPVGLFLLEQFRLIPGVCIAGVYDRDPSRCRLANECVCPVWEHPSQALSAGDVDAVMLVDHVSSEFVVSAMKSGMHVVLDRPWTLSGPQVRGLVDLARGSSAQATFVCLRRWSSDFLAAAAAIKTGRIGTLRSARFVSHEMCIAAESASWRFLAEVAFTLSDQLLMLTESGVRHVFAERLHSPAGTQNTGLIATLEFENGCVAQFDLQTQSRLSQRTGWMLEGVKGSFREDRLYEVTSDGEVIDEPLPCPTIPANGFVQELVSSWNGQPSLLPTLADAARVVQLTEMIERSVDTHEVVRM